MPRLSQGTKLENVEYILGSGTGTLDFAVEGEDSYFTWEGPENADWSVHNVDRVENDSEDRITLFPSGDYFTCDVTIDEDGQEIVICK